MLEPERGLAPEQPSAGPVPVLPHEHVHAHVPELAGFVLQLELPNFVHVLQGFEPWQQPACGLAGKPPDSSEHADSQHEPAQPTKSLHHLQRRRDASNGRQCAFFPGVAVGIWFTQGL